MIRIHALLALLWIGGCSELSSIEPNVCGNGVVEANEDCDSFLGHCFECSLVCTSDADCTELGGPGFVCGLDALCHAPSGSFRRVSQVAVDVDSYRIARTTDGPFGDVIAQSSSSVSVLYGDAAGSLATSATLQSPIAQGPVTFAKLDGDAIPDLLVPTADGIAAFTFGYGVPTPYTFPNLVAEIAGGEPLMTFNIGAQYLGGVAKLPGNAHELVILEVGPGGERVVGRIDLCSVLPNEVFAEGRSDVHVMPGAQMHAVFSTVLSSGRACAIAIDEKVITNPADPFHLSVVTPALIPQLDASERAILVRFPATRCPTFIAQNGNGGLLEFPGKDLGTAIRPCVFEQGRLLQRRDLSGAIKFTGAPLGYLPVGTVAAPDVAIVLNDGVYLYDAAGFIRQFYVSDRQLAGVETIDLDGDQRLDLVARGDSSEDLDLLYQIPLAAPLYGVLRVRFDTDGDVSRLLPGDYDGNFRSDIAYVERIEGRDRLMIAYGTSDRPLAGQAVGMFEGVFSMIRVELPDSTDPFGIVADLGVLYGFGVKKQIALLHGSPQRTMQAYFDPRISLLGPGVPSGASLVEIGGVIPGHFNGGLGGHDILGIASSALTSSVYVTPAAPDGELSSAARCGVASTLVRCFERANSDDQTSLCTDVASYLPWAMSATHDVVIGIDGRGNALTFDPVQAGECSAPTQMTAVTWTEKLALPPPPSMNARRVRSIAKVGPDSSELMIAFAPGRDGKPADAAIRVCSVVSGGGQDCEDPAALIAGRVGAPVVCSDLASGRATQVSRFGNPPPPVPDLFAVCGVSGSDRFVYRVSRFADRTQVDELFGIGRGDEIEVGDVNGDAVDDIVVLERGGTQSVLHVFTQCSSRNATDCVQIQGEDGAP
jgi:hypothetical protein